VLYHSTRCEKRGARVRFILWGNSVTLCGHKNKDGKPCKRRVSAPPCSQHRGLLQRIVRNLTVGFVMAATCFLFALADHLPNLWNSNKKNHDNATLSGTPRSGGSTQLDAIPITVQVSDSSSPPQTATRQTTIPIIKPGHLSPQPPPVLHASVQ